MAKTKVKYAYEKSLLVPLLAGSGLSAGLLLCRFLAGQSTRYWYMIWNLFLGWLPIIFAWWLRNWLRRGRWSSWQGIALTALWLGFLPNSFYIITDFIHLKPTGEVSLLFDAVLLTTFSLNGLILGLLSVSIVHTELKKRLAEKNTFLLLLIIFLLTSFGVYLGRYLAWNTWDILINPLGILFDISDRIINPLSYPTTFTTTGIFFVLLTTLYFMAYRLAAVLRRFNK
jgi:uncharacterized membrane protein